MRGHGVPLPGRNAVPKQRRTARSHRGRIHAPDGQLGAARQQRRRHGLQTSFLPLVHSRILVCCRGGDGIHLAPAVGLGHGCHDGVHLSVLRASAGNRPGPHHGARHAHRLRDTSRRMGLPGRYDADGPHRACPPATLPLAGARRTRIPLLGRVVDELRHAHQGARGHHIALPRDGRVHAHQGKALLVHGGKDVHRRHRLVRVARRVVRSGLPARRRRLPQSGHRGKLLPLRGQNELCVARAQPVLQLPHRVFRLRALHPAPAACRPDRHPPTSASCSSSRSIAYRRANAAPI